MNRGGSWNNDPENCRSANRNRNTPENRNNNLGFRLALPAAQKRGRTAATEQDRVPSRFSCRANSDRVRRRW